MRKYKYLLISFFILLVLAVVLVYSIFLGKGIKTDGKKTSIIIPEGSSYQQVLDSLNSNLEVKNMALLDWVANRKRYPDHIRPGKYVIESDLSYVGLINMLRSGSQTPVKITFNNIRTLSQLAGRIGKQIEADSTEIIDFLSDEKNYIKDGFKKETVISVFIPNTYELYWNTGPEGLYSRMLKEYNRFWNNERQEKAESLGLTRVEVSILASIIDDEVLKAEEKPRIAGVYLNRLRKSIPLQACPTIKFALNDFTITRVLNKHLEVDSPYNTYKHRGFPPGPIGCPTIEGIEAVLNAEKNDFYYFAARADFSGYHNFSKTLAEHNRYAAEYQRELDRRKIFK